MDRRTFIGAGLLGAMAAACARRPDDERETEPSVGSVDLTGQMTAPPDPASPASSASSASSASAAPPTTTAVVTTASSAPPPTVSAAWAAADFLGLDSFVESTGGRAFMIIESGDIVHEWYRDDAGFARDIASAQKSVLSLIVGRAIDLGLLAVDSTVDSVLGTGWATGDSTTITVEHLLTMTSGLDDARRVIDQPGRAWRYNNAFAALFDVVESVTDRQIDDVAAEWLFDPIGASGAAFRLRPNAFAGSRVGLVCTAPQLAEIGAMVLGRGPQQVSRSWLDDSFAPSQRFNPAYGRLWWLNGQSSYLVPEGLSFEGPLIPHAPLDVVAALGKDDQKLYVCPSLDLVVVRLGGKAEPNTRLALSSFDDDLWTRLMVERSRVG